MKKRVFPLILVLLVILPVCFSQNAQFNVSLNLTGPTCSDLVQNQNETGVDCGGSCPACPSIPADTGSPGSYSGRSSGSSVPFFPQVPLKTDDSYSKYVLLVKSGDLISIDFNKADIALYEFGLKTKSDARNVTINIKNTDNSSFPDKSFFSNLTFYAYNFFNIYSSQIKNSNVDLLVIEYRIPIDFINGKNQSFRNFDLYYYNRSWVPLETVFESNDDKYYYFRAKSLAFGDYAAIGTVAAKAIYAPITDNLASGAATNVEAAEQNNAALRGNSLKMPFIISFGIISFILTLFIMSRVISRLKTRSEEDVLSKYDNLIKDKINVQDYEDKLKELDDRIKKI